MKSITLHVTGIHCASCVANIEQRLSKLKGIVSVNINLATKKANIEFDDKILSKQGIANKIMGLGYEVDLSNNIDEKVEIRNIRNLFLFSLIFSIPTFIIGMLLMWLGINIPYKDYILFALATPVQFIVGWGIYKSALFALKNKTANMDTLIAIGTSAAYFFSVYVVFFSVGDQYFEAATILITFVMLGRYL